MARRLGVLFADHGQLIFYDSEAGLKDDNPEPFWSRPGEFETGCSLRFVGQAVSLALSDGFVDLQRQDSPIQGAQQLNLKLPSGVLAVSELFNFAGDHDLTLLLSPGRFILSYLHVPGLVSDIAVTDETNIFEPVEQTLRFHLAPT